MNKFEELSAQIIDEVCEVIEDNYDIEPKPFPDCEDNIDNPALINGVAYYELEAKVAELIDKIRT